MFRRLTVYGTIPFLFFSNQMEMMERSAVENLTSRDLACPMELGRAAANFCRVFPPQTANLFVIGLCLGIGRAWLRASFAFCSRLAQNISPYQNRFLTRSHSSRGARSRI